MDCFNYDQDRISNCCHHLMDTTGNRFVCDTMPATPADSWNKFSILRTLRKERSVDLSLGCIDWLLVLALSAFSQVAVLEITTDSPTCSLTKSPKYLWNDYRPQARIPGMVRL